MRDEDVLRRVEALLSSLERREGRGSTLLVAELWKLYAEWGEAHIPSWGNCQRIHWQHLSEFWGHKLVESVTLADADDYRKMRRKQRGPGDKPIRPATRNREMASMRACFSWSVKRQHIPRNPLAGMEKEDEGGGRRFVLDEPSFQRLLSVVEDNPVFKLLLIVAYGTGMRRGEICALEWSQVDLEERLITLHGSDTKNRHGRVVPLLDREVEALAMAPRWSRFVFSVNGGDIHKSTLYSWFIAARKKAGIPSECKFHSLRHSAATNMRRRGVPYWTVRQILGHRTDAAASVYQHHDSQDWSEYRRMGNEALAERKGPKSAPGSAPEKKNASGEKF